MKYIIVKAEELEKVWDIRVYFEEWARELPPEEREAAVQGYMNGEILIADNGYFYHSADGFDSPIDDYWGRYEKIVYELRGAGIPFREEEE